MPDDAEFFKEKTIVTVNGGELLPQKIRAGSNFKRSRSKINHRSSWHPLNNNAGKRAVFTYRATTDLYARLKVKHSTNYLQFPIIFHSAQEKLHWGNEEIIKHPNIKETGAATGYPLGQFQLDRSDKQLASRTSSHRWNSTKPSTELETGSQLPEA